MKARCALGVTVMLLGACEASRTDPIATTPRTSLEAPVVTAPLPSPPAAPVIEAPAAKPAIVRRPGAYANLDPDDDDVVGPPERYEGCEREPVTMPRLNSACQKIREPTPIASTAPKRSFAVAS